MKQWEKPEVKVFDIKMEENIAASGDATRPKAKGYMEIESGVPGDTNTIKSVAYYTDTNMVIETSYAFIAEGSGIFSSNGTTASVISTNIDDAGCHGAAN